MLLTAPWQMGRSRWRWDRNQQTTCQDLSATQHTQRVMFQTHTKNVVHTKGHVSHTFHTQRVMFHVRRVLFHTQSVFFHTQSVVSHTNGHVSFTKGHVSHRTVHITCTMDLPGLCTKGSVSCTRGHVSCTS